MYTKALFQQCFHVTSNSDLTLREFWKDHFNIFHCLRLIEKAWDQISERCLCSAWKKLWLPHEPPQVPCDSEASESEQTHEEETVMEEIVTLSVRLGLEVDENDVNTLVEEHNAQLTTQDLKELHKEQQQEVTGELSSEDDVEVQCKAAEIKDFLHHWAQVQDFAEKWHPNTLEVRQVTELFQEKVVEHFHNKLKKRQTQTTLDCFITKKPKVKHNYCVVSKSSQIVKRRASYMHVTHIHVLLHANKCFVLQSRHFFFTPIPTCSF